jgi:CheY-like chemotaxis protein
VHPDLILVDLMMPVMNGWQFRAEQMRDPSISGIPAVVISGGDRVAEHTKALGAADYLRKPIDLDVLLATVQRYVRVAPS